MKRRPPDNEQTPVADEPTQSAPTPPDAPPAPPEAPPAPPAPPEAPPAPPEAPKSMRYAFDFEVFYPNNATQRKRVQAEGKDYQEALKHAELALLKLLEGVELAKSEKYPNGYVYTEFWLYVP